MHFAKFCGLGPRSHFDETIGLSLNSKSERTNLKVKQTWSARGWKKLGHQYGVTESYGHKLAESEKIVNFNNIEKK